MIITRDDMESMSRDEYARRQNEQLATFRHLRVLVGQLLEQFGRPDFQPEQQCGDYSVHGDYGEYPQVVVFVHNLGLLRQPVVDALQGLARQYPGWHIDLMIGLWGHLEDWPEMGISIRANEIVDDLKREYFPKEFQNLAYEGARCGSVWD